MSTIQPGKDTKVLVSGANGFVAIWLVRTLLEKGYSVRGTVRSAAKGKHLEKLFGEYGDRLELVIVDDITKEGAFDEAVKGVQAIAHTASPFHLKAEDPEELIQPAVKGTVGILESALKHGSSVQRIVVTSSVASIMRPSTENLVLNESDWNEHSIADLEKNGKNASQYIMYQASKTLAEKAAWDFVKKNKESIKWDLSVLCPPYVFGPVIHEVSSAAALNTSMAFFYAVVTNETMGGQSLEALETQTDSWVDVRDLVEAHVLALEKEAAGGERIIISAGPFVWQEWLDAANSLSPSPIPSHTLPKVVPGAGKNANYTTKYDTSKEAKILGLKYHTKEEMTRDALADYERRGW